MEKRTKSHLMGLEKFRHIYFHLCRKQFIRSLTWSVSSTLLIVFFGILFSSKNGFQLITIVTEVGLKITPPLLGFTLSSFALVVGFKDDNLMKKLKGHITKCGISMYLQLVVTFIAMLGSVFLCLLLCVFSKIILSFEIKVNEDIFQYVQYVNYIFFTIITLMVFYALFAIKDLLSNLYSLGNSSNNLYQVENDKQKEMQQSCISKEHKLVFNDNNIFVYIFMGILYVIDFIKQIVTKIRR